eukprot:s2765_g1.t1
MESFPRLDYQGRAFSDSDLQELPLKDVAYPYEEVNFSQSQWALPDFICQLMIAVGTAGLQSRLPDRSGHCRALAATVKSQWALPDISRDCQIAVGTAGLQPRLPDRSGHCRTSTRIHARLNARGDAR